MTKSNVILAVLIAAAAAGVLYLAHNQATLSQAHELGQEVFKLTYQFFLLVVLGGAVSIVYKVYSDEREAARAEKVRRRERAEKEQERERERHREQARAELERRLGELRSREERWSRLSAELVETYNGTKRIRRLLRARALKVRPGSSGGRCQSTGPFLQVAAYDELMQELIDFQLSFERHKRLARSDPHLAESVPDLVENLGSVERYLNKLIGEYEQHLPSFEAEEVSLEGLTHIAEYIGPYRDADKFQQNYKEPFLRTLEGLREAIARTWERKSSDGSA